MAKKTKRKSITSDVGDVHPGEVQLDEEVEEASVVEAAAEPAEEVVTTPAQVVVPAPEATQPPPPPTGEIIEIIAVGRSFLRFGYTFTKVPTRLPKKSFTEAQLAELARCAVNKTLKVTIL